MKCTQFQELRVKMLQLVENEYLAFKSLNDEQKLIFSQMRTKKSEGFKQREEIVKSMIRKQQVCLLFFTTNYYQQYWLHPHHLFSFDLLIVFLYVLFSCTNFGYENCTVF